MNNAMQEIFKLRSNPFRVTPSNPTDLIWAGFEETKRKIESRIKRSITIPNSSLVLNWGDYGSGKTHAAKYFQKVDVLNELSGNNNPLSLFLMFPQGKDPVKEIYTQIIDKLDIDIIRESYRRCYTAAPRLDILKEATDNVLIQNVLKLFLDSRVPGTTIKAYLYGNSQISQSFIDNNVQRKFESDNDYSEFISSLFTVLTYNKEVYPCIVLWIDEFESISILNSTNVGRMNYFIRSLMDRTPNNLLVFMNLTQSALMDVNDLGEYLHESVKSRIKLKIELSIPDVDTLKNYIKDLLNHFREEEEENYFPFTEEVIEVVIRDLNSNASLRKYNEVFGNLIEFALADHKNIIDLDYYNQVKEEIIY